MAIMTGNIRTLGWPLGLDADDVLVRARGDYESAAEADVKSGITFGGSGTEYTGILDVHIPDTIKPMPVISSTSAALTNDSPIPCAVKFSESVVNFVVGDLTICNGSAGNFAGSGTDYTFDLTPSASGAVTADIVADVCQDSSANLNVAAEQFKIMYDGTEPTATLSSTTESATTTTPIPVTITFNEAVTGFVVGDIVVVNGSAGNFAGSGSTYTVDITPTTAGAVTVDVAAGVAIDAAGNSNTVAVQLSRTYTVAGVGPTVALSSNTETTTSKNPIPVIATFSDGVTGFTLGDIVIGNGSASNLAGAVFTFDVTPTVAGAVTIDVPVSVCVDTDDNPNQAATQLARTSVDSDGDVDKARYGRFGTALRAWLVSDSDLTTLLSHVDVSAERIFISNGVIEETSKPYLGLLPSHIGNVLEDVDAGILETSVLCEAYSSSAQARENTLEIIGAVEVLAAQNVTTMGDASFESNDIQTVGIRSEGLAVSGEPVGDPNSGVYLSSCVLRIRWRDTL